MKENTSEKSIEFFNSDLAIVKQNRILTNFMKISMQGDSIPRSCEKMLDILKKEYAIDFNTLLLLNEAEEALEVVYTDVDSQNEKYLVNFINEKLSQVVDIKVFETRGDYCLSYQTAEDREIRYAILLLLKTKKQHLGALLIEKKTLEGNRELELESFKTIIETLTMSLENLLLHEKVRNMAIKDQLTAAYNRRYLYDEFVYKVANDYSLSMLDIDFFKRVNDTYGHAAGDKVLIQVSKILNDMVGDKGTVFRFGGEEFLAYIPRSKEESYSILNAAREYIEKLVIHYEDREIRITISAGIADTKNASKFNDIRDLADKALYRSKENGRNQINLW